MHNENLFLNAVIYMLAAVISVPIAKRIGLGSVLGYLLAGICIGPFLLNLVGNDQAIMHFAEFGVVMMLFVVGLELQPSLLWKMRAGILGMGGAQVGITIAAVCAICWYGGVTLGPVPFAWQQIVALGMVFSLSSTAIVLQTMAEKGQLKTPGGQSAFSVLLFQDMAVIPMLSLLPLLAHSLFDVDSGSALSQLTQDATGAAAGVSDVHKEAHAAPGKSLLSGLPAWQYTLVVLGFFASVIGFGKFGLRHVFRVVAETGMREVFTALALIIVIGIALLTHKLGLSPALGTFLAGVVLAESEYKHELEAVVDPFKGLLLGLFFVTVGAGIDFAVIAANPQTILLTALGIMVLKGLLIFGIGQAFGLRLPQNLMFATSLAQVGEFGFVVIGFAGQLSIFAGETQNIITAIVALSMLLTPLVIMVESKFLQPNIQRRQSQGDKDSHEQEEVTRGKVIVVGYGRFGQIASRLLSINKVEVVLLDQNPKQIELVRRFGIKVFYGDGARPELLELAGASEADCLLICVDDKDKCMAIVEAAQHHFPKLKILARAVDRDHAYALLEKQVSSVVRETFSSALDMGIDALRSLGFPSYLSQRQALRFKHYDEQLLHKLAKHRGQDSYIAESRKHFEEIFALVAQDRSHDELDEAADWSVGPVGSVVQPGANGQQAVGTSDLSRSNLAKES